MLTVKANSIKVIANIVKLESFLNAKCFPSLINKCGRQTKNFIVHEINTKTTAREFSKVKKYANVRIVTTLLSAALIENGT